MQSLLDIFLNFCFKNKLRIICVKKRAIEKLITHSPHLLDLKKHDEFAPLHLAALNGHRDVIKILLDLNADIEISNKRKQTPLLLAVSQIYPKVIELLVEKSIIFF
jgi:ankyrin repeat protein